MRDADVLFNHVAQIISVALYDRVEASARFPASNRSQFSEMTDESSFCLSPRICFRNKPPNAWRRKARAEKGQS